MIWKFVVHRQMRLIDNEICHALHKTTTMKQKPNRKQKQKMRNRKCFCDYVVPSITHTKSGIAKQKQGIK